MAALVGPDAGRLLGERHEELEVQEDEERDVRAETSWSRSGSESRCSDSRGTGDEAIVWEEGSEEGKEQRQRARRGKRLSGGAFLWSPPSNSNGSESELRGMRCEWGRVFGPF